MMSLILNNTMYATYNHYPTVTIICSWSYKFSFIILLTKVASDFIIFAVQQKQQPWQSVEVKKSPQEQINRNEKGEILSLPVSTKDSKALKCYVDHGQITNGQW